MNQESAAHILLTSTLQLAVPLWIAELKGKRWDYIIDRARICSGFVAEKGDLILFKSKKKGESAEAFNRLAEGIACLAFCPGGVGAFGQHWESCLSSDEPIRFPKALRDLIDSIKESLDAEIANKEIAGHGRVQEWQGDLPGEPRKQLKRRVLKRRQLKRKRLK